jgi:hypothetical protein
VKTIAKINCLVLIATLAAHTQCAMQSLDSTLEMTEPALACHQESGNNTTNEKGDGSHHDGECGELQVTGRKDRIASNIFLQRSSLIGHHVTFGSERTIYLIASVNGDSSASFLLPSHGLVRRI